MSEPLMTSFDQVKALRNARYNPLSRLNARMLARALDNFEQGQLREAALLFEVIAERDDTIKSVKPKREKEVSQLDWQIMPVGSDTTHFDAQKEVLENFWNSVRAVNAYDRNEKGGFGRLVRQMMTSVSNRYAAHHIVWNPSAGKLSATFEFVPLWLFENTTGTLRYLKNPFDTEGETLATDEWMVTVGDGLMISCSIGYFAKRQTFNDWLIFSEKFSMPGVLGRTNAKKGSPEGEMMRQAVESFGHDWNGVLYGDDGTVKDPIQLITTDGNPAGMPMPSIIERVDRKFAALYRGADLSTMSSSEGEGTGASLQGEEKDILLTDDADVIKETLAPISLKVLQWYFGYDVVPVAELQMVVPADEDGKFVLEASTKLADMGAPVSKSNTMERLGLQKADDANDLLKPSQAAAPQFQQEYLGHPVSSKETERQEQENAKRGFWKGFFSFRKKQANAEPIEEAELSQEEFDTQSRELMKAALQQDLQPIMELLAKASEAKTEEEQQMWLKLVDTALPHVQSGAQANALSRIMAAAFLNPTEEEL